MLEGAGTNYKGPLAFDLGLKDLRHISLGRDKKTFQKRKNIRKDDKPYMCVCVCVCVCVFIYIYTWFKNTIFKKPLPHNFIPTPLPKHIFLITFLF